MRFKTLLLTALFALPACADDDYIKPISDQVTKDECSACHLAFPASMLPKASWEKIMANLDNHFGEDASLDAQTTNHITRYLSAEAGDSGLWSSKFLRGLNSQNPPIRITETKYWIREHRGISDAKWKSDRVGSKANCAACHRGAERGDYEDE